MEKTKELYNCTFVKTFLMLTVVLYHSVLFWSGNWFDVIIPARESVILPYIARWMNSFHIYGFTLVSGYLFYYLKTEKGKYASLKELISNKTKRLLIPYFFVLVTWVMPIGVYFFQFSRKTVIEKYVLGVLPNQLWFLLMLFNVFCICWLLYDYLIQNDVGATILAVALFGVATVAARVIPNYFQIWNACKYVIYFLLGMKLRQKKQLCLRKVPTWCWVVMHIILFVISELLTTSELLILKLIKIGVDLALHICGALMAWFVLQTIANVVSWEKYVLYNELKKHTMPIYLYHQQIVYLCIIWLNGRVNPYLNSAINFTIAILSSVLISIFMTRMKWTRKLLGEQKEVKRC